MTSSEFLDRFEEIAGATGWRTMPSPAEAVERWRSFVEACEEGFGGSIYELENERSIRRLLDRAFGDPVLQTHRELDEIRLIVDELDVRLRRATRDDVSIGADGDPWWARLVPRVTFGELETDLRSLYGIEPS